MHPIPRRTQLLLVLAVLAVHLLLLTWWTKSQSGGGLSTMSEPEFNRALLPTGDAEARQAQQQAAQAAAMAPPPPTVGQVVQARTLPASAVEQAAATAPKSIPAKPARVKRAAQQPTVAVPPTTQANTPTQPAAVAESPSLAPPQPANPPDVPTYQATTTPPPPVPFPATPSTLAPDKNEQNIHLALLKEEQLAINSEIDASAWLATWPLSTRLSYKLEGNYRGPLYGQAQVQWQRTAERYQAQIMVTVGLFLDMRLTSQGRITPARLWPQAYEESRRGKKRSARLGDQTLWLDNGGTVPRPPQLQDTASQFVQLAQDFATGRLPLKVGTVVPVTLARPGGVDEWIYDVVALDTLDTPLGPLAAYHLKPRPLLPQRSGVAAEMWFAPSLQHLPARIRLTLNAETWLDLMLEKVAQSP